MFHRSLQCVLIVFVCIFNQNSGLKLLKHLTLSELRNYANYYVKPKNSFLPSASGVPENPCANVFEYRYDDNGKLYGFLQILPPQNVKKIEIELVFCIANQVQKGAEGTISLPYESSQEVIDKILANLPLNFKVNFPEWVQFAPKITKISVNGNLVCSGQPYSINDVPILTTITLWYKLNIQNEVSDSIFNQRNFKDTNKYSFNPKIPDKDVPKIKIHGPENVFEHYSENPFLNPSTNPEAKETSTEILRPIRKIENPSSVISDGTSQFYGDVCGRPVVTNALVFYGQSVPKGAFPWLVAMFLKTKNGGLEYHCSATLISKRHILTAAHCIKFENSALEPESFVFVLGRLNIQNWGANENEKIMSAERIFIHPEYKPLNTDADLALILLQSDVIFSKFIRPICLWRENDDLNQIVGLNSIVVGWGKDEEGNKISAEAKQIQLPIVSQEQCLRSNLAFVEITSERTFCAGDRSGSGPCNGDSGAGLILLRNGRWTLRGIVSMSLSDANTRTCDLKNYIVFTDVSKFTDWILDLIK